MKMINRNKELILGFFSLGIILGLWFLLTMHAFAHQGDYQCNENNPDNCPIPTQICNNGEHVGNPHCEDTTPTLTPTVTPKPECEDCDEVTPTLTPEVTATPSVTITPEDVHHEPSDETFDIHGDGKSDGRSDGLCSKPPCVTPYVDPKGTVLLPVGNSPK